MKLPRVTVIVLGLCLGGPAEADLPPRVDTTPAEEPPDPSGDHRPALAGQYARVARDAARTGNCEAAREAHEAARAIDPSEGGTPVDPAVAICLGTNLTHARYLRAAHEAATAGRCADVRDVVASMWLDGLDAKVLASTAVLACLVEREVTVDTVAPVPPLSFSRILGGAALGTVFAIPALYAGFSVGVALSPDRGNDGDIRVAPIWGAYAGGVVGVAVGVYAVGVNGDQTGSLAATLAGALVGGMAGVVLTYAAGPPGLLTALVTPYVGALVGFHRTRRYETKAPPRVGSLVTRTHDRWSLGIPLVVHAEHATTFSLVSGSF